MSDFMADLGSVLSAGNAGASAIKGVEIKKKGSNMDLDMTDFLTLMITELTHQGIDESVNTSDMLNQMVQMQMVTALANMTDASIMGYAASLVNQKVTVAQYDSEGNMQELVGIVTGTGTMNGNQVIFLDNGKYYQMSEIMAVGVLPKDENSGKTEDTDKVKDPDKTEDTNKTEDTDKSEGAGQTESTDKTESSTVGPQEVPEPPAVSATEDEYHGENGADVNPVS